MMTKKVLSFALVALLSIQNTFSMELENSTSGKKSKTLQSKVKKSGRPSKRQKASDKEKEAEEDRSMEDEQQQDQEALSFDVLPFELRYGVWLFKLQCIIQNNTVFAPLDGVKEFLNTLSLVNKEWNNIAADLGWNNRLSSKNIDPKYKMMVKAFWVSTEILEKNAVYLSAYLRCVLSDEVLSKVNKCISIALTKSPSTEKEDLALKVFQSISNTIELRPCKLNVEKNELAAKLLIAGANPNLEMEKGKSLLIFVLGQECFHKLIPLLILRRVNISCSTGKTNALMHAVFFPEILQMLLEYDSTGINVSDHTSESPLDKATMEGSIKSVKLLLEYGAGPDSALWAIMLHVRLAQNYEINEQDLLDVKIAKLLIEYGANIEELPAESLHPIINKGWLLATRAIQDFKQKLASQKLDSSVLE